MKKITGIILAVLLMISAAALVSAADLADYTLPENGIHFSFDNTTADDTGAVTGTASDGVSYTEDRNGKADSAIKFDGTEQYVAYNCNDITGDWTCSVWIRVDKESDWSFLLMSYNNSLRPRQTSGYNGQVGFSSIGECGDCGFDSQVTLEIGKWYMLTYVASEEAEFVKLYIDGAYSGEFPAYLPLAFMLLGNDTPDNRGWVTDSGMTLDDLYLFPGIISEDNIKSLYNDGAIAAIDYQKFEKPARAVPEGSYALPYNGIHFTFDETLDSEDGSFVGTASGDVVYEAGHSKDSGKAVNFTGTEAHAKYGVGETWGDWTCSTWIRIDEISTWDFLWIDYNYSLRPLQNSTCGAVLNEIGVSTVNIPGKANIDAFFDDCFLELEEWAMITYVGNFEEEWIKIYVNGEYCGILEEYYIPLPLDLLGNDAPDNCGWMIDSTTVLDDMWLFGRCLSEDEIVMLYENGAVPAVDEPAAVEETAAPAAVERAENYMEGTIIGNETGWDGTEACGAAKVFDGDAATFFDPLGVGDGFAGMQYAETYILEKVRVLSRDGWNARFVGAMIQGSNDGENWTTLYTSDVEGTAPEYFEITDFENNTGYSMFRYYNETNHGDVAEVEFYGAPGKVEEAAPAEEAVEEPEATEEPEVVEEETVEEPEVEEIEEVVEAAEEEAAPVEEAAQTSDASLVIAAVILASAAAAFAFKKEKLF